MNEDLLHWIWKYRLYPPDMQTVSGQPVEVISPGIHNKDAGPDFVNARIRIGQTLWAGNVEIHVRSSDWYQHGHHQDEAFSNLILHVVYDHNQPVISASGQPIETLQLRGVIDERIFQRYHYLLHNACRIPCEKNIHLISTEKIFIWIYRVMIERLERKSAELMWHYTQNRQHFEETFYQVLAGNFGMKVNREPFEMLAKMLPLKVILKHHHSLFQLEALLFGVAGFLQRDFQDEYPAMLKKEFDFLREKYILPVMSPEVWKFLRLRPNNFPTIRLAQFAVLLQRVEELFRIVRWEKELRDIKDFLNLTASPYWNNHYQFEVLSEWLPKRLGKDAVNNLIINTLVLMMFFYGKIRNEEKFKEMALSLLQMIEPEKNAIIRDWARLGIIAGNALESQALIELRTRFCNLKRCLDCSIGLDLIKGSMEAD